jgi:hypothetical protein
MHKLSMAFTACILAACGGGGDEARAVANVAKSLGSVQCTGGGTTLGELQSQLVTAHVQVLGATCGLDGVTYPAVCGAPDGAIAIFQVPVAQQDIAHTLGFVPLGTFPDATVQPCR